MPVPDRDQQEILAQLRRAGLSRRTLLRGAGMGGAAALLAACGVKGTGSGASSSSTGASSSSTGVSSSAAAPAGSSASGAATSGSSAGTSSSASASVPSVADRSDTDKTLNWSNWPEYIDVGENNASDHPTLDAFTKETGIKVTYTEDVNDNNQYFAKIQPQLSAGRPINADLFVVTDWMAGKLIQLGWVQPLDHALIPNLKNLQPALMDVPFDKGRKYSLTWQSGLTGIAQNPAALGGKKVESMDQLLTDSSLRGKVTLLTEMRDTVGLTLLDLGYNPEDFTDEQFTEAMAKLQAAVDAKQIRQFTGNDYAQGLVAGDIAACLAWTGDVVTLKADNPDLQYVLPEAGYTLWSDNLVVPILTPHKKNAETLINYYYQPAVAAQVAEAVNYITPVVGTKEVLAKQDPETAKNVLIFPDAATLSKAKGFMELDPDQEKRYNAAFAKLSGA
ncbi:polyamine ABC transporter substrate-binding protein [Nakamurella endophytica]|uniref:ABC transporter substrate-binding protein n=1 Tax=Nakamurella endophytica TaxID=1748367 RepID=A0A917WNH0_9ACTN|nr:spermidine/putrescine ABC transporter substrate-binding protein [Nakamurella endophytica]GGM16472.1 ABC transporter substrate-binding protein [Nakamurella endophytica]